MKKLVLTATVIGMGFLGTMASAQSSSFAVFGNNISSLMGVATLDYAPPGSVNYANGWRQWSQTYSNNTQAFQTLCRWNWGGYRGATAPDATPTACASVCNGNPSCQ